MPLPKKKIHKSIYDDFILTLSDDDSPILEDEELEEVQDPLRKRKREIEPGSTNKKRNKKKKSGLDPDVEQLDAETPAGRKGVVEDDGALAPDFEFDVQPDDFEEPSTWQSADNPHLEEEESSDLISRVLKRLGRTAWEAEKLDEHLNQGVDDTTHSGDESGDSTGDSEFGGFDDGTALEGNVEDQNPSTKVDDQDSDVSELDPAALSTALDDQESDLDAASGDEEDQEDPEELERRAAFYAPADSAQTTDDANTFLDLGLERPIMRGLTALGFTKPTPIQRKTIPVALAGRDVVGGAETGSGKTAAFLVPILDRLLMRNKKAATTRVAILMPTRELATQCYKVGLKLAQFTDIRFALVVGGMSSKAQEQELKRRPDVIVATPGRFIDHMRNTLGFTIETIEILVLDEADRMLEDGFSAELDEILKTIPRSRQTMLFSATVNESVDELIRVGLRNPVRLVIDTKNQTVAGLVQEFVRLRPGREDLRMAHLLTLCSSSTYRSLKTIVFFRTKQAAHLARILFAIFGFPAAEELHGDMTQEKRNAALDRFHKNAAAATTTSNGQRRSNKHIVNFLMATDVASRGLDIKGVEAVINYDAPQTHEIYLHRVGRTARAGRSGRACTFAAEEDRKVIKSVVKSARRQQQQQQQEQEQTQKAGNAKIASLPLPLEQVTQWHERIEAQREVVAEALKLEKEERLLEVVERELQRGENLVRHAQEIHSRPKKTWFESEDDKRAAKSAAKLAASSQLGANATGQAAESEVTVKKHRVKQSNKEKKKAEMKEERKEQRLFKKKSKHHTKRSKARV